MVEGLEVTIKYRGTKYHQVASPATPSSEFAILKKDLAHLRVHSPSQKNVRRVNGSFILHWPTAGTSTKVTGLVDSLHQRWFKLCSDDPEALKLRNFLSIESITLVQDGVQICSTAGPEQASPDAPPGTLAKRLGESLPEVAKQPATLTKLPAVIPPPRVPPVAPRFDRQPPPHLPVKRRISGGEDSPSQTRQKLDVPESTTTTTPVELDARPEQVQLPTSPMADPQPISPIMVGDTTLRASPQPMEVDDTPSPRVPTPIAPVALEPQTIPSTGTSREPGEMTPRPPVPTPPGPSSKSPAPGPGSGAGAHLSLATRPPLPSHSSQYTSAPRPASPYGSASLPDSGDHAPRRRDRDANRLMRELWDTRRHLTAMQARERVLLDDLERLGVRPDSIGGSAERNDVSRDEMTHLQADLKAEKARRMRAERALSDVERECRAPFVVPALFRAFLSISELSS